VATALLLLVAGFLLGSLPWSLWWARSRGIDLRKVGSGNLGATNVYRALGLLPGLAVLALDIGKGTLAVILARTFAEGGAVPAVVGLAAVAGHMASPFARFRGGKGVATGFGVFLGLAPLAAVGALLVWGAALILGGWVSVASALGALVLPVFVHLSRLDLGPRYPWALGLSILVAVLIIVRHRANWARLARGREQAIWENRPETPGEGAAR
jgi:glycerol-3-phosphate acyltransferase PlsY